MGVGRWRWRGGWGNGGGGGGAGVRGVGGGGDLSKSYTGKGNTKAVWREGRFTDGQVNDLLNLFQGNNRIWAAVYLYREIEATHEIEVPVSLGSDDTLTVWLNGEKLLANNVYR